MKGKLVAHRRACSRALLLLFGLIPGIRNRWRALIGGSNSQAVISCPLSLTLEPQFHICAMTGFGVGARAGGVHNGPNSVRFNEIYSQRREDHWVCDEQRPPDLAESWHHSIVLVGNMLIPIRGAVQQETSHTTALYSHAQHAQDVHKTSWSSYFSFYYKV